MSLTIDELSDLLLEQGVKDQTLRSNILKAAKELEEAKKEEKGDAPKKGKNKLTVFIRCEPENEKILRESAAFILKSPEETPDENLKGIIRDCSITQNRNVKRKGKINTWADFFKYIKGKNRKEAKIVNVTKFPVQIIPLTQEDIDFG